MKTFIQFIAEVNRPKDGTDVEKERWDAVRSRLDKRDNPDDYFIGQVGRDKDGNRKYGTKTVDAKKKQLGRRADNLPTLKKKEVDDWLKRNRFDLSHDEREELSKTSIKRERAGIAKLKRQRKKATETTGVEHHLDHKIGQADKTNPKLTSRWNVVSPGTTVDNMEVITKDDNLKKNSKGKRTSLTRAGAIVAAIRRGREQQNKNNQTPEAEHSDIVNHNKKLKKRGA